MNVFYFASDAFVNVAATSIFSLLKNNIKAEAIHIYLVDDGISDEKKHMLTQMIHEFRRDITYIPAPDPVEMFEFPFKTRYQIGHSYPRMCIGRLLPPDVDKVLCLDSDTLVLGDLTELWELDLGDNVMAGVPEPLNYCAYRHQFHLNDDDIYCNAGMFLIDLKKWREQHMEQEIVRIIQEQNGNVFFFEQTLMNYVCKGKIYQLDLRYNSFTLLYAFSYDNLMRWRRPSHPYRPEDVTDAKEHPVIIHFTRCFYMLSRPWVDGCNHPYTEIYRRYKALTPWPESETDTRSFKQKFVYSLWHLLPERAAATLAGILYNNIRPLMRWKNE